MTSYQSINNLSSRLHRTIESGRTSHVRNFNNLFPVRHVYYTINFPNPTVISHVLLDINDLIPTRKTCRKTFSMSFIILALRHLFLAYQFFYRICVVKLSQYELFWTFTDVGFLLFTIGYRTSKKIYCIIFSKKWQKSYTRSGRFCNPKKIKK